MTFIELHQHLEERGFRLRWERGSQRIYYKERVKWLIRLDYRPKQKVPQNMKQYLLDLLIRENNA
jgi:predicted RNA binding protein YcfA (HicA-like mRNA interferase family)